MKEYALKFTKLSKYAPTMAVDSREMMSKFASGVSEIVVNECHATILINDMDIFHLIVHAEYVYE